MKNDSKISRKEFFTRILLIDLSIFIFALIISICGGFQTFSIVLFVLGLLLAVIGAYLPGTFSVTHEFEKYHPSDSPNMVQDHIVHSLLANTKAASGYSPENILLYSGLIVLIISLPFICIVMYL
jgi:fatty acid desaturase